VQQVLRVHTARDHDDLDDYDEDRIGDAVSHAAMPATNDGTTLVSSWLMDTGCPLDLIDESDAAPCADLIRRDEGVVLATANGELRADRVLPLHIDALNEEITPLVLPNTPNVLSIGKSVVDGGYDFVWRNGERPYLTHPEGSRHIDLTVRDNCPYLDVAGGITPTKKRRAKKAHRRSPYRPCPDTPSTSMPRSSTRHRTIFALTTAAATEAR